MKRGDYYHNMKVIQTNSGLIIPNKRARKDIDASNFLPCPYWFCMYRRNDMWKNVNTCNDNKKRENPKPLKQRQECFYQCHQLYPKTFMKRLLAQ